MTPPACRVSHGWRTLRLLAVAGLLVLSACPALPFLIPPALEFARNLLTISSQNYSKNYTNQLETLLLALANTNLSAGLGGSQGTMATFAGQQPGAGQPQVATTAVFPTTPIPETGQGGFVQPGAMAPQGYPGTVPGYQGGYQQGYPTVPGGVPQAPGYPPGSTYPPQTGSYPPYSGSPGTPYGTTPAYPQTSTPAQGYGTPSYGGYAGAGYPPAPGYPTYRSPDAAVAPPAAAPTVPIGLEVALVRQQIQDGQKVPVIMQDGDVLKDGRGDPQAGDKFKIVFRPDADGYVYVISIDGSGWAQGLFPMSTPALGNPVSKDRVYVLPEGKNWFSLDQFRGIETIYFVASYRQRPDIEETLRTISGRERPASAVPQQVTEPAVIPEGFGTSAPGKATTIKSETGQGSEVNLTAFRSRQTNEDLRLTRWFRHE